MNTMFLASQLDTLGDGLFDMLGKWADRGLKVALVVIVLVTICRQFSLKAGIGALLAMAIALGIYSSRDTLAGFFSDKIKNPSTGSAPLDPQAPRSRADGKIL
ncbi:hypothetical protein AB0N28_00920 [Streptomyces sp. NPDC051130]|uniref:hypothetical protein n=1 Tax=Streptomyces sp. NPDC051130 TaxID=3157223 RepID=UPI003430FA0C